MGHWVKVFRSDGGGGGERASERACLLYQISTVGAPRHYTRSRLALFFLASSSPDDLSSVDCCSVTGILLYVAFLDYAADLVAPPQSRSID